MAHQAVRQRLYSVSKFTRHKPPSLRQGSFCLGLAGSYAIEQFLGKSIREHGVIDIVVFRDSQIQVQHWLADWQLYAADPPKQLRLWVIDEYLPFGIHAVWCHKKGASSWQLQIMLAEVEDGEWFSRRIILCVVDALIYLQIAMTSLV